MKELQTFVQDYTLVHSIEPVVLRCLCIRLSTLTYIIIIIRPGALMTYNDSVSVLWPAPRS